MMHADLKGVILMQNQGQPQITEISMMLNKLPSEQRAAITNRMLGMCFMALAESTKDAQGNEGKKQEKDGHARQ